ncbi:MAG: gluconate 2-dehydrogenase subunit 3 family protein [Alphaproteobacteria bacterium]|nr:gluconate 2-dehydrogenase subunit 3 family protein [Alphaproteobacteria bacterium]
MIDRRDLIRRAALILGGSLSAGAIAGVLSGCASAPEGQSSASQYLVADESLSVTALCDRILPRTDTPGAVDVGVVSFLDRMMAEFYGDTERSTVRAGLTRVNEEALSQHGQRFHRLPPAKQIALMTTFDEEATAQNRTPGAPLHFFRIIKELTILGFFTSEYGASQFLRYDPIPGPYRADVPYSEVGRAFAT